MVEIGSEMEIDIEIEIKKKSDVEIDIKMTIEIDMETNDRFVLLLSALCSWKAQSIPGAGPVFPD